MKITGILHVGAHRCEEREAYHAIGMTDQDIIWIEGNISLVSEMRQVDGGAIRIYPVLAGDVDNQEVDFIITNNGQSSSILELHTHKTEHPHVVEVAREKRHTMRLDSFFRREQMDTKKLNFLNLDIQGAELLALRGLGDPFLSQVQYIYTEVNTKELYKNCARLDEIDDFLSARGFVRKELEMTEYGWGDAFYVRV